jgi:hypothetical protein
VPLPRAPFEDRAGLLSAELARRGLLGYKAAGRRMDAATSARRPSASDRQDAQENGMTEQEYLRRLERTGWLDEVPPDEAERIRQCVRESFREPGDEGQYADGCLVSGGFDSEAIDEDGDYARAVLPEYASASFGVFEPTEVADRLDPSTETVEISFSFRGKHFQRSFPQPDDLVADGLHEWINEILEATGIERRFFLLPTGDQMAALAFVRPRTYERAYELGLIPDETDLGDEDWD